MKNISIRYKILVIILSVLSATVVVYLYFAVRTFNKDKIAYIYDSSAMLTETLADETDSLVNSIVKSMNLLDAASGNEALFLSIFNHDQDIIEFYIYDKVSGTVTSRVTKPGYLEMYNVDKNYLDRVRTERPIAYEQVSRGKLYLQNSSMPDGAPILTFVLQTELNHILISNIRQDRFLKIFAKSQMYKVILVDKYGKILSHSDPGVILREEQLKDTALLKKTGSGNVKTALHESVNEKGEAIISSYSKTESGDLFVISEISKKIALTAAYYLVNKSILFAMLLISVGFIISLIFSKTITNPIRKIFNATKEVSKGNFQVKVDIGSKDEIGVLADSFNKMTSEIERLMEETRDKVRMEKEIEVAKAVQDTLFPAEEFSVDTIDLSLYYKPATECGGDWFDYIDAEDRVIILIGDATGHGVPAALITASAHSCCTVLQEVARNSTGSLTPSIILKYLNASIHRATKGRLLMTFFAGSIDKKTGLLTYSNASHNPPVVCGSEVTPLMEAMGPRLGEGMSSVYTEAQYGLETGDVFVLFTDGVIEIKNKSGAQWGSRRFTKILAKNQSQPTKQIKEQILAGINNFSQGTAAEDDITFIVGKYTA
jgi:phosphoserine phosphatase RsbU/P